MLFVSPSQGRNVLIVQSFLGELLHQFLCLHDLIDLVLISEGEPVDKVHVLIRIVIVDYFHRTVILLSLIKDHVGKGTSVGTNLISDLLRFGL